MKLAIVSVSTTGFLLAKKIENRICNSDLSDFSVILGVKSQYERKNEAYIEESLKEYVAKIFYEVDAILFISATGIALRMVAPLLDKKQKDPAILVMDETGKYCISMLSGHLGGANELTKLIAKLADAIPVITTATDRQEKFAVDNFAKENGLTITDFSLAKEISAEILQGDVVDICFEKELVTEELIEFVNTTKELKWIASLSERVNTYCVYVGSDEKICKNSGQVLCLIPMKLAVGIGCRKDTNKEKIEEAIRKCLKEHGFYMSQIKVIASVDLKKDETGIIHFCKKYELPFITYSADELSKVEGSESASSFVKQITGVDNVCERAALCYGGNLIVNKTIYDGVTVAISRL